MKNKGVRGFAVHPGGIITPLQRHLANEEMVTLGWKKEDGSLSDLAANFFKSPTQGASTTLWCATNPALKNIGGEFYLIELSQKVSSSAHIEFHARIIQQKFNFFKNYINNYLSYYTHQLWSRFYLGSF